MLSRFILALCVLLVTPLSSPAYASVRQQQLPVDVTFSLNSPQQEVGSYQTTTGALHVKNNAQPTDKPVDIDITLVIHDGAQFGDSKQFQVSTDRFTATLTRLRLLGGGERQAQIDLTPMSNAVGNFAIEVEVSLNGQPEPALNKTVYLTLGASLLKTFTFLSTNSFLAAKQNLNTRLVQNTDHTSIQILLTNPDKDTKPIDLALKTYSGIDVDPTNSDNPQLTVRLLPNETRVYTYTVITRKDAFNGRYTILASAISEADKATNIVALTIGYGPYVFEGPHSGAPDSNGIYLDSTAIPPQIQGSTARTGTVLIWVENTNTNDAARTFVVTVSDPEQSLMIQPGPAQSQATNEPYSVSLNELLLGPQEAALILITFNAPDSLLSGTYSLQIDIKEPGSSEKPIERYQPIELVQ